MTTVLDRLLAPVYRWLYADPALTAGSSGAPVPVRSMYDATNAMSSIAAFPWVMACVEVISTDLSGIPLVAVVEGPNGTRKILRDHPVLDLLRRPSSQASGVAMRRQLYADFALCREAFVRVMGTPGVDGVATRLHPAEVKPVVDAKTGLITGYEWGGQTLRPSEILMVRGVGWRPGTLASRAESPIHALEQGLLAAKSAREHARKSAGRGQLQMLLRPTDPMAQFGSEGVERIKDAYRKATESGDGLFVLNRALEATPLELSAREQEFSKLVEDVRNETLAVFGVPPVLVGLPGANYGTARAEARIYWERRKHDARLFDDEFSRLTGDPRVRIEHDFTDVEALQTTRTERQQRAAVWVQAFGVRPVDAARYEGFDDAPVDPLLTAKDVGNPRPAIGATEGREEQGGAKSAIRAWQDATRTAIEGGAEVPTEWLATDLRMRLILSGVEAGRASAVAGMAAGIVRDALDDAARSGLNLEQSRLWSLDLADALEAACAS